MTTAALPTMCVESRMEYDSVIVIRDMKVTEQVVNLCMKTVKMFTMLVTDKMAFLQSFHLDGRAHHLVSTVKWIMVEDGP